jgi:CDGSH-type Zn-finger protein
MRRDKVLIIPYQDGPYLVRGPVVVRDQDGRDIELTRNPVALCRCGKSRMRPFCDGTHRLIRFTAPSTRETYWFGEPEATTGPLRRRSIASTEPRVRRAPSAAGASNSGSGGEPSALAASAAIPTKLEAVRERLGRVTERLVARLQNGSWSAREYVAMRSAERLIEATSLLLSQRPGSAGPVHSGRNEMRGVQTPCCCLIRGALEAVMPACGADHISELIGELRVVLELLEAGRWA